MSKRIALRPRGEIREGDFSDAIPRFAALRRKPCEWIIMHRHYYSLFLLRFSWCQIMLFSPQTHNWSNTVISDFPRSLRLYSTLGGICGYSVRTIRRSASNSFRLTLSVLSEMFSDIFSVHWTALSQTPSGNTGSPFYAFLKWARVCSWTPCPQNWRLLYTYLSFTLSPEIVPFKIDSTWFCYKAA